MALTLTKPTQTLEGLDFILYGKPKVGKTSTLDDPVYKVLMLDLEGGSAVLSEAGNVDRIPINSYQDLIEAGKGVQTGYFLIEGEKIPCDYDLVAIDSLTQFESLVKEYIVSMYAPNRKREIQGKFGSMQDFGDLKDLITRTVKWYHSLTKRGEDSVHLCWIAHEASIKDEITGQTVQTKIQLQGSNTAEVVMSIVDGVFYMYNKGLEDGSVERGILTKPAGIFQANARQSKRRDPLPAKIVDPVWSEIIPQLGYIKK